jgi:hypothetical protein
VEKDLRAQQKQLAQQETCVNYASSSGDERDEEEEEEEEEEGLVGASDDDESGQGAEDDDDDDDQDYEVGGAGGSLSGRGLMAALLRVARQQRRPGRSPVQQGPWQLAHLPLPR